MATAWIREYDDMGGFGKIPIIAEPGRDLATVTFTTTTQSAAFADTTKYIRFVVSADAHYVVGASPTATTAALKCFAGKEYDVGVRGGQKIAFVTAS